MVIKNIVYSLIIKATDIALPIILLPILLNRIGPEIVGSIGYFTALTLFFIPFIQYGMAQNGVSLYLQSINDGVSEQLLSTYFTYSISISLFISCIVAVFCFYSEVDYFIGFFTCLYVIINGLTPNWYFQALSQLKIVSLWNTLIKIFIFVYIYLYVNNKDDAVLYPALLFLGSFFIYVYQMLVILRNNSLSMAGLFRVKKYLIEYFPLFKIQFVPNFYNNFSIYYLSFWCDEVMYGYFISAQRITEVFSNVNLIAINSFLPKISNQFTAINQLYKVVNALNILLITSVVVGFFIPQETYGNLYPVFLIFSIMCPALIIHSYMNFYGLAGLSYFKSYKYMSSVTVTFSIIGFAACLYFISIYGLLASILTVLVIRFFIYVSFKCRYHNVTKKANSI